MRYPPTDSGDDVDRVFARLRPIAPPPMLAQRILASLPAEVPAPVARAGPVTGRIPRRTWQWVVAAATLVLVIMSLRLGTLLDDSGALAVLGAIAQDFGSFLSAPGDYLTPLIAELPWFDLSITLGALIAFWVSSTSLLGNRTMRQPSSSHQA